MTPQERKVFELALAALENIVNSLATHDDEGMIEHAQPMIDARETIAAIKQVLAQPEQEPVQTTPNFAQLKQILDNLDRCHHRDSKQEFLRTWIRDWTEHKLTKHTTPPQRKPLSDYVNSAGINANDSPHIVLEKLERAIESEVKGLNNA